MLDGSSEGSIRRHSPGGQGQGKRNRSGGGVSDPGSSSRVDIRGEEESFSRPTSVSPCRGGRGSTSVDGGDMGGYISEGGSSVGSWRSSGRNSALRPSSRASNSDFRARFADELVSPPLSPPQVEGGGGDAVHVVCVPAAAVNTAAGKNGREGGGAADDDDDYMVEEGLGGVPRDKRKIFNSSSILAENRGSDGGGGGGSVSGGGGRYNPTTHCSHTAVDESNAPLLSSSTARLGERDGTETAESVRSALFKARMRDHYSGEFARRKAMMEREEEEEEEEEEEVEEEEDDDGVDGGGLES